MSSRNSNSLIRRAFVLVVGNALVLNSMLTATPALSSPARGVGAPVSQALTLPDGRKAVIYNTGLARIESKNAAGKSRFEDRTFPHFSQPDSSVALTDGMPDRTHIVSELMQGQKQQFIANEVIVVFRQGISAPQNSFVVPVATLHSTRLAQASNRTAAPAPAYTNDLATNTTMQRLGVDKSQRLFEKFNRATLQAMRSGVRGSSGAAVLDIANAYRLHITGSSVHQAVEKLLSMPSVVYASPNWTVSTMQAPTIALPRSDVFTAASRARTLDSRMTSSRVMSAGALPSNYALAASAQSMLNAPGNNAVAALSEIQSRFHQLPGQGEIITNVSLGDLDDVGTASNTSDPCSSWAFGNPTTTMIGGQRYIDWPSMPLIPAYVSDASGNLSGTADSCGQDQSLGEVGLDFSMMAPLPHDQQRAGEIGAGVTDLLGIAPGAQYRLVIPAGVCAVNYCSNNVSNSDIDAAFLAAATQMPRPNVITASLGFGEDSFGFPSRYLEDDPLTEAVIAAIVHSYNIVVCVSAGDGTRTFTWAPVGPSGGSAPTNSIGSGGRPTDLNDVGFSTTPSQDFDSGSIDVGGTTLDDIFAAPPQDPQFASLAFQHAFPETRWTGFTSFSSNFGSRVNVSAPSDNVLAISHQCCTFDSVQVSLSGGTSASAPETAAAAAIALQVARLTGHPIQRATDVRDLLAATGTPVPPVSQSDVSNFVGPQINIGRLVESLFHKAGQNISPAVGRIAVEQRRNAGGFDAVFLTDTNPGAIDLQGPVSRVDGSNTDRNERAWITIAPDWEAVPAHTPYELFVSGKPHRALATTPWARLLPSQILDAAGLPLVSSANRTVDLTYRAGTATHPLAQASVSMTFGPADATTQAVLAPIVPSVVNGATMHVLYDLTNVRSAGGSPRLVVSEPGRTAPDQRLFRAIYTASLNNTKGAVDVPVSALQGGGIYGVAVAFGPVATNPNIRLPLVSDFAFTRVAPTSAARPAAPLLSINGLPGSHFLEVPYGTQFQLTYNVANVPDANGAVVEVSAPGPTLWYVSNPFNNPNGTVRDANGFDTGSEYFGTVNGVSGTVTLDSLALDLDPSFNQVIRVLPTAGGRVVGEAGDVSSIMMDGLLPLDGGFTNNGFAVNASGTDGFLTSGQLTASGQVLSSVDTFDQKTNAITHTAATGSPNSDLYFTLQSGVLAPDAGLFGDYANPAAPGFHAVSYSVLSPVAAGAVASSWTPPIPYPNNGVQGGIASQAYNSTTADSVFLAYHADPSQPIFGLSWDLFGSNVVTNASGPVFNVTSQMGTCTNNACYDFTAPLVENAATNTAIVGLGDQANANASKFVNVDMATGNSNAFTGLDAAGFPTYLDMAVDSTTNKLAVVSDSAEFAVYDLATHAGGFVPIPDRLATNGGNFAMCIASDTKAGRFLIMGFDAGNLLLNSNALSAVLEYDETPRLLHTYERFNYNGSSELQPGCLQVNGDAKRGYTFGLQHHEVMPFRYR